MKISSIFFDKESWSIYATCNVAVFLALFVFSKQTITFQSLIVMSLLAMMKGDLKAKIIYTCFLNFLLYKNGSHWKHSSLLFVVGVLISHYIQENHIVQMIIQTTPLLLLLFRIAVVVWVATIFSLMYNSHFK